MGIANNPEYSGKREFFGNSFTERFCLIQFDLYAGGWLDSMSKSKRQQVLEIWRLYSLFSQMICGKAGKKWETAQGLFI